MATTITVQQNQGMLDVIIQATGSLEAGMQFCLDNNVGISDTPAVGTVYVVSDAALGLGDAGNRQYLAKNNIVIGTLATGETPTMVYGGEDGLTVDVSEDGTAIYVPE
jgi:hypothetical protein